MRQLFLSLLLLSLTACAHGPLSIHKIPVQQGNALTQEKIKSLYEGMSQKEVISLLGNPVTQPMFNKNRWDYVFLNTNAENKTERLAVSLHFKDGFVEKIQNEASETN